MHDKRGRNHQVYMWQYGSLGKGVVFDFRMGRDGDGPKQSLGQFIQSVVPRLSEEGVDFAK